MTGNGWIDSHAHLDFEAYRTDRDAVLERAWEAGLTAVVTIGAGGGVEGNSGALELAAAERRVWATVGIHPHDSALGVEGWTDPRAAVSAAVRQRWEEACGQALERLRSWSLHPKVVAIGEAGLDYHYDHSPRELQRELFRRQVRLAIERALPLVIHTREAESEAAEILSQEGAARVGGVIHCYGGDAALTEAALGMGFCFGLTGILTFPRADQLRQAVRRLPLERLLIETDSPYLAPVPYRGKRNEPAHVVEVGRRLASLLERDPAAVADQTSANARRLFGLDGREAAGSGQVAYRFRSAVYLNITNRCTLACTFCLKHQGCELAGIGLGLLVEPTASEVLRAAEQALGQGPADEVVFCGLGEPLLRPSLVAEVGRRLRVAGRRVRVNTDGLAHRVHGREVLTEMEGALDAVSVSLNAPDAATYQRLCPSRYGAEAFEAVCDFIRRAVGRGLDVRASAVRLPGVDMEATRLLAEHLGAVFWPRG